VEKILRQEGVEKCAIGTKRKELFEFWKLRKGPLRELSLGC
jgi:hypothetical protein